MTLHRRSLWRVCALLAPTLFIAVGALAVTDDIAAKVRFTPVIGERLGHLRFASPNGDVDVAELVSQGPSLLTFAWFECHNLCGLVLNGLADSSADYFAAAQAAEDVQIIVVSMAAETPRQTLVQQGLSLAARYPGAEVDTRWHFLSADKTRIETLAATLGFHFVYDEQKQQFAHPAGVVALDAAGRITDFRSGFNYRADDIEALVASTRADSGSRVARNPVLLLCYDYDPQSGRYSFAIMKALRLVALVFLVLLGATFWRWHRHDRRGGHS